MATPESTQQAFMDMRKRVLDGESVPREELAGMIARLREDRAAKTKPKAAANIPTDLNALFKN